MGADWNRARCSRSYHRQRLVCGIIRVARVSVSNDLSAAMQVQDLCLACAKYCIQWD